jgi:hypothetical protein
MDSDNGAIGALIDHGYRILVYCEARPAFGKRFGLASGGYFAQVTLFKMLLTSVQPDDTEAHARWALPGTDIWPVPYHVRLAIRVRMVPSLKCQTW